MSCCTVSGADQVRRRSDSVVVADFAGGLGVAGFGARGDGGSFSAEPATGLKLTASSVSHGILRLRIESCAHASSSEPVMVT